jgi:hypothetical protein
MITSTICLTKARSLMFLSKAIVNPCLLSKPHAVINVLIPYQDTETGPGVLETALAYTSALRMADNAILFKYTAKSIGMKHGVIPSFMAKPWNGVCVYLVWGY